ncbi:uncharacterized protein LOC117583129 [Drosophila guanche]|uniref:uncharacterized protein LOC117583129 n=1 Tax=Drosophila guanche TaxID=7266 RepID=UPI0014712585|nr:uncharacterized protein LOC117583129 [Drosophila guanche]
MKPICAATVSLLVWISLIRNGHAVDEPPLSVLRAEGDDGKPPLIVLTSSITMPVPTEGVKYEATEPGTNSDVTAVPETPQLPTRAPHKKKPPPNGPQAPLLSMPEMWNSFPLSNAAARPVPVPPSAIPFYYPLPVYIPYPIPFVLNYAPEDQSGVQFNELLPEQLSKERKKIRKGQHPKKTASRNLPTKWQDSNPSP